MPRFYFDLEDPLGVAAADSEGIDLADAEAAIDSGIDGVASIFADEPGAGTWTMLIRGEDGRLVATLKLCMEKQLEGR